MNRTLSIPLLVVFGVILLLAGMAAGPGAGWAQTVPQLPAVHPLYGDCEEDTGEEGTVPQPVFEPFLPNSIYVDWCGHALLTIAQPATAAGVPSSLEAFDPRVGHRIGLFYTDDDTPTGWMIAKYSYRVRYTASELATRKTVLLREICPLGNPCNELLLANISHLSAQFSLLNADGEVPLTPVGSQSNKLFAPFVSRGD
jgi:hypothetical protein